MGWIISVCKNEATPDDSKYQVVRVQAQAAMGINSSCPKYPNLDEEQWLVGYGLAISRFGEDQNFGYLNQQKFTRYNKTYSNGYTGKGYSGGYEYNPKCPQLVKTNNIYLCWGI